MIRAYKDAMNLTVASEALVAVYRVLSLELICGTLFSSSLVEQASPLDPDPERSFEMPGHSSIWCCWIVGGRRWPVVLLPILSLISAIGKVSTSSTLLVYPTFYLVSKVFEVYHEYFTAPHANVCQILYISFVLATTLSCTLLIIYRILTVTVARRGAEGRLRVFHHFIEVLVESSALYSICLILDLAFTIRDDSWGEFYSDVIATIAKGIAPTLIVGRVAAGHTRPNDDSDCDEIAISTLCFQLPSEFGRTDLQGSTTQTSVEIDIEAQQ
ncbi:hypothetical protein ARMGADRAFT_1172171 [Armillaria gallica]|uniref:Uncharacterized protein n=1 Tax=Armillaria gallica TaxID=47427 RepID=A0A2H3CA04_ARMGA|nr:hypothetical protein ARMGADRAFT_1172171 [Armillaria gallica]